jgi:hypothetical protein
MIVFFADRCPAGALSRCPSAELVLTSLPVDWVTVYDLREDGHYVESVQHATLTWPGYGLDPDPALFGSNEWWLADASQARSRKASSPMCGGAA